jgi:hypothetical protein
MRKNGNNDDNENSSAVGIHVYLDNIKSNMKRPPQESPSCDPLVRACAVPLGYIVI